MQAAANFLVYLMLPFIVLTCMGIGIAINNIVPLMLWLISFPTSHWLLQYDSAMLGKIILILKHWLGFLVDPDMSSEQNKILHFLLGSILYVPISISLALLYSKYRLKIYIL